ncbi:MAG TPA: DUF2116 family Zn-ribbon domain-containing protein [Candidatus Bathyarchaeia archaeon]|nr:DUF2116 family Zn-ribbon domain-containing protein [Candidatus Bathyarchaeia archaeon]
MSNDNKPKNNSTELFWIQGEGMSRRNHNIDIVKKCILQGDTYQQIWMKCGRYFTSRKFDEYYNFALDEINNGIEPIKLRESPKKEFEYGGHSCFNCGKGIPLNLNFCSEICAKEYSSKKKRVQ